MAKGPENGHQQELAWHKAQEDQARGDRKEESNDSPKIPDRGEGGGGRGRQGVGERGGGEGLGAGGKGRGRGWSRAGGGGLVGLLFEVGWHLHKTDG